MHLFGNMNRIRGCYAETTVGSPKGTAAYLSMGGASLGGNTRRGKAEPYFISGMAFSQQEKFSVVQCFNERNFVYSFGHDPVGSVMDISVTTFLVNRDGSDIGEGLERLTRQYKKCRLSQNPKQGDCVLTIGSRLKVEGFLIGMSTGTVDAKHNLQSFTYKFVITNVQG